VKNFSKFSENDTSRGKKTCGESEFDIFEAKNAFLIQEKLVYWSNNNMFATFRFNTHVFPESGKHFFASKMVSATIGVCFKLRVFLVSQLCEPIVYYFVKILPQNSFVKMILIIRQCHFNHSIHSVDSAMQLSRCDQCMKLFVNEVFRNAKILCHHV
jgi:hypothetical protein